MWSVRLTPHAHAYIRAQGTDDSVCSPPLQTPVELPDVLLAQASILFYANRHREAVLEEAGAEEPVAGDKEEQEQLQAALAASLQLQKGINAYMSTTGDDALQYEGAPAGDKLEEEGVTGEEYVKVEFFPSRWTSALRRHEDGDELCFDI